jgi:hypothetical protein
MALEARLSMFGKPVTTGHSVTGSPAVHLWKTCHYRSLSDRFRLYSDRFKSNRSLGKSLIARMTVTGSDRFPNIYPLTRAHEKEFLETAPTCHYLSLGRCRS